MESTKFAREFPYDIDLSAAPYNADLTGLFDCREIVQSAVDGLAKSGGGTVFLPKGDYRLCGGIFVKPFVTLRGEEGSVILADVESSNANLPALFEIGGSAGVMDITIYYPNQSLDDVKPYPFTFSVSGAMLQTISGCTVINGYNGIAACTDVPYAHEMMTIENFRGTFLRRAAEAYNQSDVGTWKGVGIDPDVWANADPRFNPPPRERIREYTRANCDALVLGDLEWTEFAGLCIKSCRTAINIVKGRRIEFAGSMYCVYIADCVNGIIVDSIDTRWGMCAARIEIDCDEIAIDNRTPGLVKLTAAQLTGSVNGVDMSESGAQFRGADLERSHTKKSGFIYECNCGTEGDISQTLQQTLDIAGHTGGIVYLKAGVYRLDSPVEVPAEVELLGASPIGQRGQGGSNGGTVLLSGYGLETDRPDTERALITLRGKNSGVCGIRIICDRNTPYDVKPTPYMIRGYAEGVYAVNCCIAAAWNGIDFRGCDRHYIKRLVSCCYANTITAGSCTDGYIEGCLQNGTVIARNHMKIDNWLNEGDAFPVLFDGCTRLKCVYLTLTGAKNETVLDTFAYGVRTLLKSEYSVGTSLVNVGADNIGTDAPYIEAHGGSLEGANLMRYNGHWLDSDRCDIKLYNMLAIGDAFKK